MHVTHNRARAINAPTAPNHARHNATRHHAATTNPRDSMLTARDMGISFGDEMRIHSTIGR
jgi:hypothetical protein